MEPLSNTMPNDKSIVSLPTELSQVTVDNQICQEIDLLTEANNSFWSSPDHNRKEYLHSFFQYPAMMVPVVQRRLIEIIIRNKPSIANVLDPYMGSGTSLVACMENGLNCFGQDINPLAILVARTRTGPYYVKAIRERKQSFFSDFEKDALVRIEANFSGLRKWFKDAVAIELSKIIRAIRKEPRPAIRRFYWVILAEVVRLTSNDRTSTFKLHIRKAEEIRNRNLSPIEIFKQHFENCVEDLNWYSSLLHDSNKLSNGAYVGQVTLRLCDSKTHIYTPSGEGGFFDLLVTSPPYGDNKTTVTYGQHSYLPLQWIDLADVHELATTDYLKSTSEIDTRGLGGRLKNIEEVKLNELFERSPAFLSTYNKLKKDSPDKLKKVVSFIYDLQISIDNIHSSLKVNSYQIWTVGNRNVGGVEIPNAQIIEEFIENKGSVLIKKIPREILHRRMATRNKDAALMTFEDILIFRKIG